MAEYTDSEIRNANLLWGFGAGVVAAIIALAIYILV